MPIAPPMKPAAPVDLTVAFPPLSAPMAWQAWAWQLMLSPMRQYRLAGLAMREAWRLGTVSVDALGGGAAALVARGGRTAPSTASNDRRFEGPAWRQWPFGLYAQAFAAQQRWWREATRPLPGLSEHSRRLVEFGARQLLEATSPANFPATNPEVISATVTERGANLLRGVVHLMDDLTRPHLRRPPAGAEAYRVGSEVAATPGRVVYRNRLIELIQYAPRTPSAQAEPVLIVPAWIMKYYVLDLTPDRSLVDWLVRHGHTVFMVSWLNPDARDRERSMDDCLADGVLAALDTIGAIAPGRQVHAVGYCLGGTLLAIAAAAMARDGDDRLRTLSLFAAQTDFSEPGELGRFIDEAQLCWLEQRMARTGYLDARQLAAAFALLRPGDRVWGRAVREYLLGRRKPLDALSAWNADGTRIPARMHAQYLRALYLRNDLAEGRYLADGRPVSLATIQVPVFLVATVADPVAPWQSVYELHRLTDAPITFTLTTGGHSAGVVNPPPAEGEAARRHYQIATRPPGQAGSTLDAQRWRDTTSSTAGSWWTPWQRWLVEHGSGQAMPPPLGHDGLDYGHAPGWYVRTRH